MLIISICAFAIILFLLVGAGVSGNEKSVVVLSIILLILAFFMCYQFEQEGIQEGLKNYKSYKPQITGTYENGKFIATDTTFIKVRK